jgi:hypothetical protein
LCGGKLNFEYLYIKKKMKDLKQFIKTTIREFLNENQTHSYYQDLGFEIKLDGRMVKNGVEVILLTNKVYEVNNGTPLIFNAFENENVDIIELISISDNNKLSKGFASEVLDDIIKSSSKFNRILQLYPQPMKDSSLNKKQLTDWYLRKGFTMRDDGIMVKNP